MLASDGGLQQAESSHEAIIESCFSTPTSSTTKREEGRGTTSSTTKTVWVRFSLPLRAGAVPEQRDFVSPTLSGGTPTHQVEAIGGVGKSEESVRGTPRAVQTRCVPACPWCIRVWLFSQQMHAETASRRCSTAPPPPRQGWLSMLLAVCATSVMHSSILTAVHRRGRRRCYSDGKAAMRTLRLKHVSSRITCCGQARRAIGA